MSNQVWKKIAFSILTTALMVALVGAFTQKTSKKGDGSANVTLRDVLEKTAKNKVKVKNNSEFELIAEADGKLAVRQKSTRRFVGRVGCGVCSGGNCRGILFGGEGVCQGCGKKPNDDCTIDPF